LLKLEKNNIKNIVINNGYLGEQIIEQVGKKKYNMNITHITEGFPALNTGGGFKNATQFFTNKNAPILLVNSDIVSEFDFLDILGEKTSSLVNGIGCMALLVLVPNPPHNQNGDFDISKSNIISTGNSYTFSGISVIHPNISKVLNTKKDCSLLDMLIPAINKGLVCGKITHKYWIDVGTKERLEKATNSFNYNNI
jgi:MurNAc alpha-1-phosphate uridylyltransferase